MKMIYYIKIVYLLARKASHNINNKAPANERVQAECIIYWACLIHAGLPDLSQARLPY